MHGLYGSPRHAPLHGTLIGVAMLLLAACTSVHVKPESQLPQPLLQPEAAHVGLLLDEELRTYTHEETRSGGNWKVELGPGHDKLFRSIFASTFQPLQVYNDLDSARAAPGLQAIFEPHIEQFSFVTGNETAGSYWAVTLRYRIGVLAPGGDEIDSLTLTGYGSALGARGSDNSLIAATRAAMRDAAAKFLVQMPHQPLAQKLVAGQALSNSDKAVAAVDVVETVPIDPAP